jgi:hypothetical protein
VATTAAGAATTTRPALQPAAEEPIKVAVIALLLCLAALAVAFAVLLLAGAAFSALVQTEHPERFLSDPEHRRGLLLRA